RDAVQPAVEGRRLTQAGQLLPGGDERFLGGIGRVGVMEQDRPGDAGAALEARWDEPPEGRGGAETGAREGGARRRRGGRRGAAERLHRSLVRPGPVCPTPVQMPSDAGRFISARYRTLVLDRSAAYPARVPDFKLVAPFEPTGDQPAAIEKLVDGLAR